MKRNTTKKEITLKKRQAMHNAIAHHSLTHARAPICPSRPTPPPFIYWP